MGAVGTWRQRPQLDLSQTGQNVASSFETAVIISSMSKTKRCEWCGGSLKESTGPGRPSKYCSASHRQMAYQARQQDQAVSKRIVETEAKVASHIFEAERIAATLQDSVRWRDGFMAITKEHHKAMQAVLDATSVTSTQSAFADISLKASSLAAFGATLDPGTDRLVKTLHDQFSGINNAFKAHLLHSATLPRQQLSEIVRQMSIKHDLVNVAGSAASLIQSAGLSKVLTSDIQRLARAANRADLASNLARPRSHEPPKNESALHEIVEPSLEEAELGLLFVLVVIAVFPGLLATSMAYVTQAAQDLLIMLRLLGRLTQADDAIPGILLLDAIIRRSQNGQ